jgi:hypothetical protein
MRTEQCVCGGFIVAPSLPLAGPYVEAHGRTPFHQVWRNRQGIEENGWLARFLVELINIRPAPYDPRRERPTAGLLPRDVSEATVRASASPSGGRS